MLAFHTEVDQAGAFFAVDVINHSHDSFHLAILFSLNGYVEATAVELGAAGMS